MDRFFPEKLLGEIFWDEPFSSSTNQSSIFDLQHSHSTSAAEPCHPAINLSAFVQYRDIPRISFLEEESSLKGSNNCQNNMSKRMIAFLRKSTCSPVERNNKVAEFERDRSFRHMISERMRRQRQRQCCLDLHSVLPHGTKV